MLISLFSGPKNPDDHKLEFDYTTKKRFKKGDAKYTALVIIAVTKWTKFLNRTSCLHDNSAYEADRRVSSLNSFDGPVHRSCFHRALN